MRNDSIWLTIALKQLPRVSIVNFYGLKKSDIEDLEKTLEIQKGKQLNADASDRTKIAIRKFLSEKVSTMPKFLSIKKMTQRSRAML
jgi:outer membrane protein insertion porin family